MLGESDVIATVAVKDINTGKSFYGEKLGLKQIDENPGGVTYESGATKLFVYSSPTGGTGQASCATWYVKNIEEVVNNLTTKGVTFEHYDMPGATLEGDIHSMGPMKAAWFKDPDGNVLAITFVAQ